jgi:hypothetical protein
LATILAGYVLVNCETMVVGVERVEVEHLLMQLIEIQSYASN